MKPLQRIKRNVWHFVNGNKIDGVHADILGNVNGIRGGVSGIRGDVTDIWGDVTDIRGDFDEIPMEERAAKPYVSDWVEE